jgi:ATP-dependent helicase/DNAse subunit B
MANLDIYTGSIVENQTEHLISRIRSRIGNGEKVDFLLPSRRQIHNLKTDLFTSTNSIQPGQCYFGTFFNWAARILDGARRAYQVISASEEWFLIFLYLQRNRILTGKLTAGSINLLQQVLVDLRESGYTQMELAAIVDRMADSRLRSLVAILNYLRRYPLTTSESILQLACESLESQNSESFGSVLAISGFYEFNPLQKRLLRNLVQRYEQVLIFFPERELHPVMNYLAPPESYFVGARINRVRHKNANGLFLAALADSFFRSGLKVNCALQECEPREWQNCWSPQRLKLVRCPNRRIEVTTAARTIKQWIIDGITAERIAVLYRGAYDYSVLIRLLLPQFGIAVNRCGQSLMETEPVRIISKIFEVNEKNFSRDSIIDLTRYTPIRNYYGSEIIQRFEYKSAAWGLSFSPDSWRDQLKRRSEYLRTLLQTAADEEQDLFNIQRELKDLEEVYPVVDRLLQDITLPEKASWSNYTDQVAYLLRQYYNSENYPDSYEKVFDYLAQILQRIKILTKADTVVYLNHFTTVINKLLSGIMLKDEVQAPDSGITIGNVMDVRGESFKAVVLLGLTDTEFPFQRRENLLLNNRQRTALNESAGTELLPLTGTKIAEEKFLFYQVINQVKEKLLITFPQFDSRGNTFSESPFLEEILAFQDISPLGQMISYETVSAAKVVPDPQESAAPADIRLQILRNDWQAGDLDFLKQWIEVAELAALQSRIGIEHKRKQRMPGEWNGILSLSRQPAECFKKPLSVTRLQQYAWCPFLYLCQAVWQVDVVEEPAAELTPLTEGLLIHAVLELLLKRANCSSFVEWQSFLERDLTPDIKQAVAQIGEQYRSAFGFVTEAVWQKELLDLKHGLELFIERERDILISGFCPRMLEQSLEIRLPFALGESGQFYSIPVRAKIDRVDLNENDEFVVIEYKRSKGSVQDPIKGLAKGIHFQIPFYLLLFHEVYPELHPVGAYSYVFREGKMAKGIFTMPYFKHVTQVSESELAELLTGVQEKITKILQDICDGNFLLNPYDVKERCQLGKCNYYEICRINPGQIEPLAEDD